MSGKHLINTCILLIGTIGLFSCGEPATKSATADNKKPNLKAAESKPLTKKKEVFDILSFLLEEEAGDAKNRKINFKNHSVSFSNDGDPYSVSFSKIATEDFNKDGLMDYIVYRESEGMLGGSANSNSEILYLIMGADDQIVQRHEILSYAPFSYNILDNVAYEKGKLKAKATQNFRTYMSEDEEELKSTDLSFVYKNGNLYEESYLSDCELAKWKNKRLFKGNSEIIRTIDMDNYTESVIEKYKSEEFEVSAEFSGCDNLSLVLKSVMLRSDKEKSIAGKRNAFLEFLKNHTIALPGELDIIQKYYLKYEPTSEYTELENLSFNFYTEQEKGKTIFRLIIIQNKNPDQTENWQITTRN